MPAIAITERFESITGSGAGDPAALASAAKRGDMVAAADLAALLTRAGWVEPRTIIDVYDAAAAGWFGDEARAVDLTGGSGAVAPELWPEFWVFIDDTVKTDAGTFTLRTAGLGKFVDQGFAQRAGEASLAYPGVPAAVAQGWPQRFTMDELAQCPDGSLGNEFHRQMIDNNFDLEVLDRDALADLARGAVHVGTGHLPQPRTRRQDAGEHLDHRGLAGAVGAEQAEDLARMHLEAGAVDGAKRAEVARQLDGVNRVFLDRRARAGFGPMQRGRGWWR